jgi:hypothetical protein
MPRSDISRTRGEVDHDARSGGEEEGTLSPTTIIASLRMTTILDQLVREQSEKGVTWTPSTVIERLGREIDNEESIVHCASKVWPRNPN